MTSEEALTIAEAAQGLDLSTARIHQLLSEGRLRGPAVEGHRARAGAPRVWVSSLRAEIERRSGGPVRAARSHHDAHAAHALKVALDASRDALRAQRKQTAIVTDLLAQAVAALQSQERLTAQADDLTEGYSEALTQLLSPSDPSALA
ncbi:hypothetical protein [Pedococcus bigeumensis]|uniref:hypothetical protein n=1 Tax=Pedococcus bigeumensis TaxID=433644 RepID=UPI00112AA939|nr:hypothetical protein [Pedococcus bigeumensis]